MKKRDEALKAFLGEIDNGRQRLLEMSGLMTSSEDFSFNEDVNLDPSTQEVKLSKTKEHQFQQWLEYQHKAGNIPDGDYNHYRKHNLGYDYDYRAAFITDQTAGATNKHWGDIGKKTNHPTFSVESIYSNVKGSKPGYWENDKYVKYKETKDVK